MFIFQFRSQALKFQLLTPLRCAKAAKGQVTWEWFMAETVMVIPPGNRDSLLWLYPCGCMVRIFYMKANRVWAT